jgi:hypothetical protein
MNIFREKSVLIEEVWFDEYPKENPNVDVLHFIERTQPIQGIQFEDFHTRVIDLAQEQEELWKSLGKDNRYKIRRSEQRDRFLYLYWDRNSIDDNLLKDFFDFHDRFTASQGLKRISRTRVRSFAESGILDLSLVQLPDGSPLVWHAHCCVHDRVCFFYGASLKNPNDTSYQSLLGRANRYHHWQDILRFKDLGLLIYDFGGWYAGKTDQKLLNINKFKEEFGGQVVKQFKGFHGITLKGKLCVSLYKILMR